MNAESLHLGRPDPSSVKLTKVPFEHSPSLLEYLRAVEHYRLVNGLDGDIDPDRPWDY
jgi:hypothetical protein